MPAKKDSKSIGKLKTQALKELQTIKSSEELSAFDNKYLGRNSELNSLFSNISELNAEQKKELGIAVNDLKTLLAEEITRIKSTLKNEKIKTQLESEKIDITLPGKKNYIGGLHPVTQLQQRAEDIFTSMGFDIYYPYLVDNDFNNFEALNMPPGHPARDSWDTFWTEDKLFPIPHTSSMQNRVLSSNTPPIRAIVPGRCFRNEATDARHEHTFTQIEGIYVDKGVKLTDMLGTLQEFFKLFFEQEVSVKFTPDFFPFVEPGGMMSLTCILCQGKGCRVCKYTGWLEVLGCGMIHPNVLEKASLDANVYSGFAWGFGLDRLIMLKHNVEDIRNFHSGKLEFIRQFS